MSVRIGRKDERVVNHLKVGSVERRRDWGEKTEELLIWKKAAPRHRDQVPGRCEPVAIVLPT